MKGLFRVMLFLLAFEGAALEMQPWFGDLYQFHGLARYCYSWFDHVENSSPSFRSPFHSHELLLGLDMAPSPVWSLDLDLRFADSTGFGPQFRSGAFQVRYLWMDDIIGDPVTLVTGLSARGTPTRSLKDVSCMSHAPLDCEWHWALGKEIDFSDAYRWRLWVFGAVGHGNRGSPWVRGVLALEGNFYDQHKWAVMAEGVNGYGRHIHIDTDRFFGYGKIRQKAIDIGARYGCRTGVWGTLRLEYWYRVLAKSTPEKNHAVCFSYLIPFSL
jgi:hypothetical protein